MELAVQESHGLWRTTSGIVVTLTPRPLTVSVGCIRLDYTFYTFLAFLLHHFRCVFLSIELFNVGRSSMDINSCVNMV
jgi:hypothetical protein